MLVAISKVAVLLLILAFAFNEFILYYLVIAQCGWATLEGADKPEEIVRVLLLSDTHLLGKRHGHWFDKLRREWQMRWAFQVTIRLHSPDVIFILGDTFDEGKYVMEDSEWETYVKTASQLFNTTTDLHIVVGNHDVGFHSEMTSTKVKRFYETQPSIYQSQHFQLVEVNDRVAFIMANSMALTNDGCPQCEKAKEELNQLVNRIECSKESSLECADVEKLKTRAKPILLQHFPLYRESDKLCTGPEKDKAEVIIPFRQFHDCLSKSSSKMLLEKLRPRLIVSGHTHDGCEYLHEDGTIEISVPSYSWRNRNNPSSIMLSVTDNSWKISRCYTPEESTVIFIYVAAAISSLPLYMITHRRSYFFRSVSRKFL